MHRIKLYERTQAGLYHCPFHHRDGRECSLVIDTLKNHPHFLPLTYSFLKSALTAVQEHMGLCHKAHRGREMLAVTVLFQIVKNHVSELLVSP